MTRERPLLLALGLLLGTALGFGLARWAGNREPRSPGPPEGGAPPQRVALEEQAPVRGEPDARRAPDATPVARPAEDAPERAGAADDLARAASRADQARAIEALLAEGSPAAVQTLLESFLASDDALLTALLEEALLASGFDLTGPLSDAFRASADEERSARTAALLVRMVERQPSLEGDVVELFVAQLAHPLGDGLVAARDGLAALGAGAVEPVAAFLADPATSPQAAEAAAWVLGQVAPEHADLVRAQLAASIEGVLETGRRGGLTPEALEDLHTKTQWVAWSAVNRPGVEHDDLVGLFVDSIGTTRDGAQAQSLAWGIANLHELSDAARADAASALFASLLTTEVADVRQSHVWALVHVAHAYGEHALGPLFHDVRARAEEALQLHHDQAAAQELSWLVEHLDGFAQEHAGE
jgi:hypothetical protein